MQNINVVRLVNGILLLIGLLYYKPLAYFVALMMIIAGLTNFCLMEWLLHRLGFGAGCKCDGRKTD